MMTLSASQKQPKALPLSTLEKYPSSLVCLVVSGFNHEGKKAKVACKMQE